MDKPYNMICSDLTICIMLFCSYHLFFMFFISWDTGFFFTFKFINNGRFFKIFVRNSHKALINFLSHVYHVKKQGIHMIIFAGQIFILEISTAVGVASLCYWEELMLLKCELMLLKCQISTNTNKNGFLLPTKCLEGVLKYSY